MTESKNIDREWRPPGENDKRSPCPGLNILANHGYLPRDGKNYTTEQMRDAMEHFNVSKGLAYVLAKGSILLLGENGKLSLDQLNTHNVIEHDASLSRKDASLGDNSKVDQKLVDQIVSLHVNEKINEESLAKARNIRESQSLKENKDFTFGLTQRMLSFGESAIFLLTFGSDKKEISVDDLRCILGEEKLPKNWKPSEKRITLWSVIRLAGEIRKKAEAFRSNL
ncbi:7429_t:CDS:2 [Ambispora gerdemannii]|uniref:7429_t:CDS:1 n=1 Tax=Ambispora gerdemannii TaxID=144530 RepID=A0A9N8ZH02_9GLOM|nr:7429_t:CDS:2 [Ambispora gerdemannii]